MVTVCSTISASSWQKKPLADRLSTMHWMLLSLDTSSSLWWVRTLLYDTLSS